MRENPKKSLSNGTSSTHRDGPVRVVVVSSVAHWWGKIQLDNLNSEKYYEVMLLNGLTTQLLIRMGVYVMITIFGDFNQGSTKEFCVFLGSQYFDNIFCKHEWL
jgi:hypothetical protein